MIGSTWCAIQRGGGGRVTPFNGLYGSLIDPEPESLITTNSIGINEQVIALKDLEQKCKHQTRG